MFDFTKTPHADALDKRIAALLKQMEGTPGDSDQYTKMTVNLAKLMELRNQALKTGNEATKIENDAVKAENDNVIQMEKINIEKNRLHLDKENLQLNHDKLQLDEEKFVADQEKLRSWKPSPDAVVTAAASVVGILFVLHYERLNVITSKAFGFVGKMR